MYQIKSESLFTLHCFICHFFIQGSDDEWEEAGGGQTHQEKQTTSPPKTQERSPTPPKETPKIIEVPVQDFFQSELYQRF